MLAHLDIVNGVVSYRQLNGAHGSRDPHKECVTTH